MNCRPCECHGHALSCHYDAEADDQPDEHYRAGGGVCDNCMHNTTGAENEMTPSSLSMCIVTHSCRFSMQINELFGQKLFPYMNKSVHILLPFFYESQFFFPFVFYTVSLSLFQSGKNCEECRSGFFRLQGSDPFSVDVCQPCNCNPAGTVNSSSECAQVQIYTLPSPEEFLIKPPLIVLIFSSSCDCHSQIGGQCRCKAAVAGRQCTECLPGWYGLDSSGPKGCISCNCSDLGTVSITSGEVPKCDQNTGQCQCKPHVTGKSSKGHR